MPFLLQLLKLDQILLLKLKLLVLNLIIFLKMSLSMNLWFVLLREVDSVVKLIIILIVAVDFDVKVLRIIPELGD